MVACFVEFVELVVACSVVMADQLIVGVVGWLRPPVTTCEIEDKS